MKAQRHIPVVAVETAVPRSFGFVMLSVTVVAVVLLVLAMWAYAV